MRGGTKPNGDADDAFCPPLLEVEEAPLAPEVEVPALLPEPLVPAEAMLEFGRSDG